MVIRELTLADCKRERWGNRMTRYLECGCCGCYHKEGYEDDCRDDDERYTLNDFDFFTDDIEVVPLDDQYDISSI